MAKPSKAIDSVPSVMRAIGDLKLISEAPVELRNKYQVRKAKNSFTMDELVASIKHNGVIFDLVVIEQKYVIAGNRRLTALRLIYPDGAFTVRTVDAESFGGDAREIALATNVGLPMHPVDRFEIIASLVADGFKSEDIQSHYAIDPKQYAQVMKLAGLSPVIRNAWRDGEISTRAAEAFTLSSDMAAQEKLLKRLKKDFGEDRQINDHAIRNAFVDSKQSNVAKFLKVITPELYKDSGGTINEDLFGDNHSVSDLKLLQTLFDGKLEGLVEAQIKDGWAFAMIVDFSTPGRYEYGDMGKPHNAERKAKAGVFIEIDRNGDIKYEYGKTKPVSRSSSPASKGAKAAGGKAADAPKEPATLSQAMKTDLTLWLRKATQEALVATGKTTSASPLLESLTKIVAHQIDGSFAVQDKTQELLRLMPPKIVVDAIAKHFDAKDYFGRVARGFVEKAIKEVGLGDHVKGLGSKLDCAKFATAHVAPTGWLPKELRTPHYTAPTAKKVAAAEPAKKAAKKAKKK